MPSSPRSRAVPALVLALACALTAAVAASAAVRAPDNGPRPGTGCGGTLWRLMTLSDPERMSVDLHGTPTTIADIARLEKPGPRTLASRATSFTRRVWQLRAVVDRYRIASNGEIVLILYSIDTGQFMDAYLPAKQCLGSLARDRSGMLAARSSFASKCPAAKAAWQLLGSTVEIGGVGFWNPSTTTRGALPNGAELRPVTNLRIVTGCGVG
jgi:hypothetical protein